METKQREDEPVYSLQEDMWHFGINAISWFISNLPNFIILWAMFIVAFVAFEYHQWHSHFKCKSKFKRSHPKCFSNSAFPQSSYEGKGHLNPKVTNAKNGSPSAFLNLNKIGKLDTNHIYMSFPDYLWAVVIIGLNSFYLMSTGILKLRVRSFLQKMGLLTVKPYNAHKLVGKICLEWMQVFHYDSTRVCENSGKTYALFRWPQFPMLSNDGYLVVGECLSVEVDLDAREMESACLDGRHLTADEAVILLFFNSISANHVTRHACANWGINSDITEIPFMQRMAMATEMYNHFGFAAFPRLCRLWKKFGISKYNFENIVLVFNHGIENADPPFNENIIQLRKFSRMIPFLLKVRRKFLTTFVKYKDSFYGIDPDAMFIGTVLHSLDHTMFEWGLGDPLWLNDNHPDYGLMAELGQFVRTGFVENLSFIPFKRHFRELPHPFHEEIYNYAVTIDKELADNMDTCVIK